METGSTRNSKNTIFQTTSSLIQKRKHIEKLLLLLLSDTSLVPFRTESSLLLDIERAEDAFHRLENPDCSSYHARLQMLEAQSNIKINEARHADHGDQQRWRTPVDGRGKNSHERRHWHERQLILRSFFRVQSSHAEYWSVAHFWQREKPSPPSTTAWRNVIAVTWNRYECL